MENNESLGSRLKKLRENAKVSQASLGALVGCSRFTIINWEKSTSLPNSEEIKQLADIFNTTTDYLLNGETPSPDRAPQEEEPERPKYTDKDIIWVPIIEDSISALGGVGNDITGIDWESYEKYPILRKELMAYTWQGAQYFIISAFGDSMEPKIHEGDWLLCAGYIDADDGEIAICLVDNELLVKGVKRNRDGTVTLMSYNKIYRDRIVRLDSSEFRVLGRVIGKVRRLEKFSRIW